MIVLEFVWNKWDHWWPKTFTITFIWAGFLRWEHWRMLCTWAPQRLGHTAFSLPKDAWGNGQWGRFVWFSQIVHHSFTWIEMLSLAWNGLKYANHRRRRYRSFKINIDRVSLTSSVGLTTANCLFYVRKIVPQIFEIFQPKLVPRCTWTFEKSFFGTGQNGPMFAVV